MVNDRVEKQEIGEKTKRKKKKLPKEISQEILKKIFKNLSKAIGIMLYFLILNFAYPRMNQERLIEDIKVFATVFLIVGIVFLEKAYKEYSGSKAINGIEFLVLSLHSLTIMHIITLFRYNFQFYLLTSSYTFSIYYVFKAIVLYTKERREYLKKLSDISEIVKKEEPIKKEAKKRSLEDSQGKGHQTKKVKPKTAARKTHQKETEEIRKKGVSKTKRKTAEEVKETPTRKKKANSQTKTKTEKKESVQEIKVSQKRTTKPKSEGEKETVKKKTTSKPKSGTEKTSGKEKTTSKTKKETQEEVKIPQEKKKRGRPKKEVVKND